MAGKDTSVEASGVAEENVVVVERGRDPLPPAGGKKGGRGQSKSSDALASLDGRTGHLEIAMGDVKDRVGMVEQNLQTLEDHVLEELESLKRAVGVQDELRERFTELFTSLQEQLDGVKASVEETRQDATIWAKKELQRRGVKDVDEAIAMAESLTEYDRGEGSSRSKEEGEASEGNHANGGGESPKAWHNRGNQASTSKSEGRGKLEEKRVKNKPKDGCFFCGGPHWAKDCRRQGKLAALVKEKDEEKAERESVRIGSIQVLNALQRKNVPQVPTGEGQASKSEGLLYMEAKLNGKLAHVLVDTGATHNFITMGEAERLGLNVVDGGGWLKTVNAEAKPLQGTIRRVEMCLGKWKGFVNFSVARMDDFKVVLGLDFLRQVNALVSPYNNAMCIMERGTACVVPLFGGTSSTMTSMRLSGIGEEAKKSEGTYLASLKVEDRVVLHEFEKRQPPRRKVGDQGKLDRGAKLQNVVPCGMAPPKEEKLSTTSKANGEIVKLIKEGLQRDPLAKELLQLVKSGKTQRYRVKGDLLYTKDGRVYVPKWRDLRKMVIRGSHDTQSTVHPGHRRTYALVTTAYFWPQMKKEVQMCVKTCHVCRQVKGESQADEAKLLDASQVLHDLQRREAEYVLGDRLEQGRDVPPKQHYLVNGGSGFRWLERLRFANVMVSGGGKSVKDVLIRKIISSSGKTCDSKHKEALLLHGHLVICVKEAKNLPITVLYRRLRDRATDVASTSSGNETPQKKKACDPYVTIVLSGAAIGRTFVIGTVEIPVELILSGTKFEGTFPILKADRKTWSPGWSIYHKVRLVRDGGNATENTLGEFLKKKAKDDVEVVLLVWADFVK
ncbi:hypothetical protein RJ640_018797 [Escallonia rubra]|uniref:Integrase zinc-binding domain-containing protein n=1 Tax=Escallonia rubra TaxID=112253 RepID=A0AA88S1W6_9ASTE|nr:hypothetical protein RJ640_018797 [Escallonia rubra]